MAQTGSPNTTPSPQADMLDAEEQAQRQKAIDTFLARTEFSKLARVLRARLSYASYKATHNVAHVPLTSLEHQLASRPTPDPALSPSRSKLNHTSNMPPPPAQSDGNNGNNRIWRSAGMSLYQAVLDPGPAPRRSRPHANGASGIPPTRGIPPSQPNGRERLAIPGRTVRNAPRRRHPHALSTEREDINAATTLTAIMRAGAITPATTLSRTSSASSAPTLTPRPESASRTPQPDDAQAAELMLFLATSPSPARPTTTRRAQSSQTALLGPPAPARVLFPTSSDPEQLPTPAASQQTPPVSPQRTGAFNLGDYINVSPSPAALPPRGATMVPLHGRRLFDEDSTVDRSRGVIH
ncbi:hypothetical protein RSOLAG1IB_01744 [Rhizoctonia solani AG-1 IB]|uniref:Uncharacterized protein n=2 Tax=Thanatephorus cucumeris (strain AG1-IB / isolate 7/3/14) TaxID=1108050 RepID=A0A0B7FHT6_THACB|nr:hypothetical protein RSOLAG1IB_01744 [Rhizoctonia solani AG-1 IB]